VTPRRLIVLVLLVALLALTPLAQASPPDQTWIGGFYDDADLDDIVLLVTGGLHAVECEPVPVLLPVSDVIALVPAMPKDATPEPVPLSEADRGPPLS
jgi:hypothetical protein